MQTLIQGGKTPCCPHLDTWLTYAKESLDQVHQGKAVNPGLSPHNQLSQVNVIQQMAHIRSYPFIRERLEKGTLRIHGWWFDIAQADVYCYEEGINQFVLIDEKEAKLILKRLG